MGITKSFVSSRGLREPNKPKTPRILGDAVFGNRRAQYGAVFLEINLQRFLGYGARNSTNEQLCFIGLHCCFDLARNSIFFPPKTLTLAVKKHNSQNPRIKNPKHSFSKLVKFQVNCIIK